SAQGRVASVMCARGSRRRRARKAGTVITASPTQFAPRTTTRSICSGLSSRAIARTRGNHLTQGRKDAKGRRWSKQVAQALVHADGRLPAEFGADEREV